MKNRVDVKAIEPKRSEGVFGLLLSAKIVRFSQVNETTP